MFGLSNDKSAAQAKWQTKARTTCLPIRTKLEPKNHRKSSRTLSCRILPVHLSVLLVQEVPVKPSVAILSLRKAQASS